jgi:hypothetical protein
MSAIAAPDITSSSSPIRHQRTQPNIKVTIPTPHSSSGKSNKYKKLIEDQGERRLAIARGLIKPVTTSSSETSWWNKYFGCFTRCRRNSKTCCSRSPSNSDIRGGKYTKLNRKNTRRKHN